MKSDGDSSSPAGKRESSTVEYHPELEGLWYKSHSCTRPGFGTQTYCEAPGDLWVKLIKRNYWLTLLQRGCSFVSGLKLAFGQPNNWQKNTFPKSKSMHQSNIYWHSSSVIFIGFIYSFSPPRGVCQCLAARLYSLNLFQADVPFIYSLKTSENQRFFLLFQGV